MNYHAFRRKAKKRQPKNRLKRKRIQKEKEIMNQILMEIKREEQNIKENLNQLCKREMFVLFWKNGKRLRLYSSFLKLNADIKRYSTTYTNYHIKHKKINEVFIPHYVISEDSDFRIDF